MYFSSFVNKGTHFVKVISDIVWFFNYVIDYFSSYSFFLPRTALFTRRTLKQLAFEISIVIEEVIEENKPTS